jgi:hypothetical protein
MAVSAAKRLACEDCRVLRFPLVEQHGRLPREQTGGLEVLGLDLLRAAEQHGRRRELVGPERRSDRRTSPGQLLADQDAVDVGGARAAISLR